jgi:predicted metal-dependent hydrolase
MSESERQVHTIRYGARTIAFELEHRKRRTLEISVYPDLSVRVAAPLDRTLDEIQEKVKKRAAWILEQQDSFSLFLPKQPPRRFVSGETHAYLGRQYRLRTMDGDRERIVLSRGLLCVYTKDRSDSARVRRLMRAWYRERAAQKFRERIEPCWERVRKHGIAKPMFQIRDMVRRWGSCSENGTLLLNSQLVKAPTQCIDYVIVHELCHTLHFNHSKTFYEFLTRVMPDWPERKRRLERVAL